MRCWHDLREAQGAPTLIERYLHSLKRCTLFLNVYIYIYIYTYIYRERDRYRCIKRYMHMFLMVYNPGAHFFFQCIIIREALA